MKNIYFTGFMATGKSRIGERLAQIMGKEFVDTDKWIESNTELSISKIFQDYGEEYFRKLEFECIQKLSQSSNLVISLGGGALTQDPVAELIKSSGTLVCLWAPVEVLSERISRKNTRPLMTGLNDEERKKKICEMLSLRQPYYDLADIKIKSCEETSTDKLAYDLKVKIEILWVKAIDVKTSSGSYPIYIGNDIARYFSSVIEELQLDCEFLMVTDQNIYNSQKDRIRDLQKAVGSCRLFRFPAGEQFKSLQTLNRLYTYMLRKGYSRKSALLQFSGGVVGDMAGFGAATYQRGIDFIQLPTSLLSMVDSSVGGKVGVNHFLGKNMIGAFYPPKAVFIDIDTLSTLPQDEFLSGMAEVIKYGVIYDDAFFRYLEENVAKILARDPEHLIYIIRRSCEIKALIVGEDEKEKGIRAILNYGHTFGHVIEKESDFTYKHGLAVALGMRVAGRLATHKGLWKAADELRQAKLLDLFGMPKYFDLDTSEAWEAMSVDKKADKGQRVFIVPICIGKVLILKNVTKSEANLAWQAIKEIE
jgi:shikimate kinase / 3-dehydroquinate synthase